MTQSDARRRPRRQDRRELALHTAGLLGTLGNDPRGVATSLAAAGVRGQLADARQCALAVYLRAVMHGDAWVGTVRVFHDRLVINTPGSVRQHRVSVMLPAAVRSFVAGFDAQQYPELVRLKETTSPSLAAQGSTPSIS